MTHLNLTHIPNANNETTLIFYILIENLDLNSNKAFTK